ncbi:MAG: CHASE2 domain-containing protein [Candidatus Omnitrophica bacterium]|nr:CHASE2 domain-containing protein [Candidatus Omnitrophota bacterium]
MKLNKYILINIVIAILTASLILLFSHKGFFQRIELISLDFSFRIRGDLSYNPRIVIVEITDSDIEKIGRWPWDRTWHAAITKALTDLGAKYIYFDIIFSEISTEENDKLFEEALKLTKNVYLPFVFQDNTFDIKRAFLPIKRFSSYTKDTGALNIYPDIDGILRNIPLIFINKEGLFYPHITLKISMDYEGWEIEKIEHNFLVLSDSKNSFKIPISEGNKMLINWTGKWKDTFTHYSFLDILSLYKDFLENKKNNIDLAPLKDSICLVGITAIGLYDIKPIPIEPEYPGIGIVANTISNILDKKFIYPVPKWINILILYLLSLMPAIIVWGKQPLKETFLVFLIGAAYFLVNILLFKRNIRMELSYPLLGIFITYITVEAFSFTHIVMEKQRLFRMAITDGLTGLYNIRYFKIILETEIRQRKANLIPDFSIIMSDVDHFKHFNDTYGHNIGDLVLKEVASVIKHSLRVTDIVSRYGGEEMIVLLRGTGLKDAINVAEKIRKNIEEHKISDGKNSYKVTASFGVSTFREEDDIDTIIKRADNGLYKAKKSGRNCVCSEENIV